MNHISALHTTHLHAWTPQAFTHLLSCLALRALAGRVVLVTAEVRARVCCACAASVGCVCAAVLANVMHVAGRARRAAALWHCKRAVPPAEGGSATLSTPPPPLPLTYERAGHFGRSTRTGRAREHAKPQNVITCATYICRESAMKSWNHTIKSRTCEFNLMLTLNHAPEITPVISRFQATCIHTVQFLV